MGINIRSLLVGTGTIIAFGYAVYKTYGYFNPIQDKSDISYASQRLELLPTLTFKQEIPRPETIIDVEIPGTAGTIRWYLAQAIAQLHSSDSNEIPYALRFCVPDVPAVQSPNKISENWIGGLKTAKLKLSENPNFCKGVKFIAGHYPFGLHQYLNTTDDVKYTVLLRDPVEQAISDTNLAYQRGYISKADAKNYLLHGRIDNVQTRLIAGEKYMGGECTAEVLEIAKQNLEKHFLLAGVTEDANTFMQVLASIMQAGPIAITKAQASGDKAIFAIDQQTRDLLSARNKFDAELYEWVKIRWLQWNQQNVAGVNELDKSRKALCITPEFAKTRTPVFMTPEEIVIYNADKDETLIREDQDYPSSIKFKSV